jgi:hypothetical protein
MSVRRSDYIASLKPGDRVIVVWGAAGARYATVDRVTPSGRVAIGADVFGPDGYRRGDSGHYGRAYITEPTANLEARAARRTAYERLDALLSGWEEWPTERMVRAAEAIEAAKGEGGQGE